LVFDNLTLFFQPFFSWNDFSSFQDIYFHSKQKRNEQVTLFNPMYISFFQNLVHTFFSFNCFFFKYFFCLFQSRLWSHIFLQKYDEVFPQWSNLKKIVYRMKRKLHFFLQNMPYESWHKGVFWEQTLLKAPRRTILPLTVVNYHKKRYHKMLVFIFLFLI